VDTVSLPSPVAVVSTSERAIRVPVLAGLTGPGLTGLPLPQLDLLVTVPPPGPAGSGSRSPDRWRPRWCASASVASTVTACVTPCGIRSGRMHERRSRQVQPSVPAPENEHAHAVLSARQWPHGPARVLDDAGEGAGALRRAPGLRCLAWSCPLGLAGGWDLGPRRARSRLGGGRLAAVHSDGHGGPKATIQPGDYC
jgi:hypothetical protein